MLRNLDIDKKEAGEQVGSDTFLSLRQKHCEDRRASGVVSSRTGWFSKQRISLLHESHNQNVHANFLPEWMFSVTDGFDIVVGNPPYVRIQTLKKQNPAYAKFLKSNYVSASKGNFDPYVVFVERGLQLLKRLGNLAYIMPHKFFNAQYGEPLRALLSKGKHLSHIVHFGDQQVFPGVTTTSVTTSLGSGH